MESVWRIWSTIKISHIILSWRPRRWRPFVCYEVKLAFFINQDSLLKKGVLLSNFEERASLLSPRWDSINVEFELQIATTDVPFQKCKQDEACGICERGVSLCNWILFKETSSHKLCSEQQRYCSHDKNHHSVNGGDAIELYCMIFYICGYKV